MAEARRRSPATALIAFILGALIAAIAVAAWFLVPRADPEPVDVPGVEIEAPKLPEINLPDAPKLPRG